MLLMSAFVEIKSYWGYLFLYAFISIKLLSKQFTLHMSKISTMESQSSYLKATFKLGSFNNMAPSVLIQPSAAVKT